MPVVPELWLPPGYEARLSDHERDVHEAAAQMSLADCMEENIERSVTDLANGKQMGMVDLRHDEEADTSEALVMPLPYANGFGPAMRIRARYIQAAMDIPRRMLVFPNNTLTETWYDLDPAQEASIDLADGILETLAKNGIKKAHIIGFSQAAMVGAKMLYRSSGDIDFTGSILGDAPNVDWRTEKELQKDFTRGGIAPLNKAINDSGLPALSEAQHSRGGFDGVRQLLGFAKFVAGGKLRQANRALHSSMADNDFVTDLEFAQLAGMDLSSLQLFRFAESLIATDELDHQYVLAKMAGRLSAKFEVVPGYGHEGFDNVPLAAHKSRKAIEG